MALTATATNSNIELNTSAFQTVLAANANRQYVCLCVHDFNDVDIFWGAAGSAVDSTGICIPGGGNFHFSIIDLPYTGEISAKAIKGNPLLYILEI